jgi:hypothetical protein
MDDITFVREMIAPSVPIPTSSAIIIGLERRSADGNIVSLKRGRWRKRNFNEEARVGGFRSVRKR